MLRHRTLGYAGYVLALLGVGLFLSCADEGVTPPDGGIPPDIEATLTASIVRADETLDRQLGGLGVRFKEIETDAAGFAGFYIDVETGDLVMRLADMSKQAQVRPHAQSEADNRLKGDGSRRAIRYEPAQYSFSDLRGFRGAMLRHMNRADVAYWDIDEVRNQLVIGVTTERARQQLLSIATRSGIPDGGVSIGLTTKASLDRLESPAPIPTHFHGTLSQHQDTIIGGLLIHIDDNTGCSAWIPATNGGEKVFATASHCDDDGLFELKTSAVFAHHVGIHDAGTEWKDPDPVGVNPPTRWADIALYKVIADSAAKHQRGWFAQTTNQTGSTTFHSSIPVLGTTSQVSVPVVGDSVHRVAFKKGWRKGAVVKVGVDHSDWGGSGVRLLDQDEAHMVRLGGDSGGPIIVKDGSSDWKILGIHVGGRQDTSIFSSMWNIKQDMGPVGTLAIPRLDN